VPQEGERPQREQEHQQPAGGEAGGPGRRGHLEQ